MNTKRVSEAIGEIDDKYYEEAVNYHSKRRKNIWVKWGAVAACFCLLAGGALMHQQLNNPSVPGGGQGADPGGNFPEGVDPVISSLAVYPASEKVQDVENAVYESISEADAYALEGLGKYLPANLPDGYAFGNAGLYETTMKNGTKYYMLRVTYTDGTETPSASEAEGEESTASMKAAGNSLVVFVMNCGPRTDREIYDAADLSEGAVERLMANGTFHISYGDVYVGISPNGELTAKEILAVIQSINK